MAVIIGRPACDGRLHKAIADCSTNTIFYQRAYSRDQEAAENEDRIKWRDQRDLLLDDFLRGRIRASVGPANQTIQTNKTRINMVPLFGYGKWCERILSSQLPQSESGYYEVREGLP